MPGGADDFARGTRVGGKYEILTRLSVGGMAELSLAVLPGPGGFQKFVALKQILPDVRRDEAFVKMFLDEARLTAALTHPNIAQVFELGHDPSSGELYLAMEFIAGQTLLQVLRRGTENGGRLPGGFSCRVMRDVCLALHSAHTFSDPATGLPRPVVHRDLSPNNVMVSFSGAVKIIDFGIAKARGRLARTQVGMVKGTSGYMSPEQAMDHQLDGRSDVFSAAVVLYELLSGRALFSADPDAIAMRRVVMEDAPSLRAVAPEVPAELADVVTRGLARAPNARWPTARDFAKAIEGACGHLFDEQEVAGVMERLLPDAQEATRALLESARDVMPDSRKLTRAVSVLREVSEAGRRLAPVAREPALDGSTQPSGNTQTLTTAPVVTVPSPSQVSSPKARVGRGRLAALVVGLGVVVLGAGVVVSQAQQPPPPAAPRPPAPLEALEAEVMPKFRAAVAAHDWSRARELAERCRIGAERCPRAAAALEQLRVMGKLDTPVAPRPDRLPEEVPRPP